MLNLKSEKIIFFCGHKSLFGIYAFEALQKSQINPDIIVLAKSQRWKKFDTRLNPNKQKTVKQKLRDQVVAWRQWLRFLKIWIKSPRRIKWVENVHDPSTLQWIEKTNPTIAICAAYPQLFRTSVLNFLNNKIISLHPSDLPAFAGAHPHFWAIRTGAKNFGLTAHEMKKAIDEGPIWAQVLFPIEGLRYQELYTKIRDTLPALIQKLEVQLIQSGKATDLDFKVNKRFKNNQATDSKIIWSQHQVEEILQIIRTETAFCYLEDQIIRIWEADPIEIADSSLKKAPGTVLDTQDMGITVQCLDGIILIKSIKQNWRILPISQLPIKPDQQFS